MQKQVEVRMDESHLEPSVDTPESVCGSLCDKIMRNMVLTLTILGKLLVLLLPSTIHTFSTLSGFQGGWSLSQHALDKKQGTFWIGCHCTATHKQINTFTPMSN